MGVTDYYTFQLHLAWASFEFDGEGGGPLIEPFVGWEGPASFPVSLMVRPSYATIPIVLAPRGQCAWALDDVELSWTVGAVMERVSFMAIYLGSLWSMLAFP